MYVYMFKENIVHHTNNKATVQILHSVFQAKSNI